jgi:hypothetical protein
MTREEGCTPESVPNARTMGGGATPVSPSAASRGREPEPAVAIGGRVKSAGAHCANREDRQVGWPSGKRDAKSATARARGRLSERPAQDDRSRSGALDRVLAQARQARPVHSSGTRTGSWEGPVGRRHSATRLPHAAPRLADARRLTHSSKPYRRSESSNPGHHSEQ